MSDELAGRLGADIGREALREASRRARGLLVEELTESLLRAARRSLAEPAPSAPRGDDAPAAPAPACYVFAIARAGRSGDLEAGAGVDGAFPVEEVVEGPLSAIVSGVDPRVFDGLADEAMEPGGRLALMAERHDEVVRGIFAASPVLPLRFGTVVTSRDAVAATLARGRARFLAELDRVDGRTEWTCRVDRPEDALSDAPAQEPASAAAGGADYLARKERALRRDEVAAEGLREAAERLDAAVGALVEASARLDASGGRQRVAYLVRPGRASAFGDAVAAAGAEAAEGIRIEAAGPLPPYHFVDVELEGDAMPSPPVP